jgi:hypothetical protein
MDGPKVPRFLGRKRFNFRFVQFAFDGSAFASRTTAASALRQPGVSTLTPLAARN